MKLSISVLAYLMSTATATLNFRSHFESFCDKFSCEMYSDSELEYRFMIFSDNLRQIMEHNSNPTHSYKLQMNHFGLMTQSEFGNYLRMSHGGHHNVSGVLGGCSDMPSYSASSTVGYDWRDHNAVTDVKNQGNCGSCWSFSTATALEGWEAIHHGDLISLSEQELVDCDKQDAGCNGGLMENAMDYVSKNGGLCSDSDYPYTAADGTCSSTKCSKKYAGISGCYSVPQNNEAALKYAVEHYGPVSIAIQANQMVFQFYSSGVFNNARCGTNLDHGVAVVGFGVDGTQPYWIVKNSWGATWGEQGYIRMARTDSTNSAGMCGLASEPVFPY